MKKNAIVLVILKSGKKFVSEVQHVIEDKKKVVVSCYEEDCNIISQDVKDILGIEDKHPMALFPYEMVVEIVPAEKREGDYVILNVPGFTISFKTTEHLEMFEEFTSKYYPSLEVMFTKGQKACYPLHDFLFNQRPSMLDRRMVATAFKHAINLSYVPKVTEEECNILIPDVYAIPVDLIQCIKGASIQTLNF